MTTGSQQALDLIAHTLLDPGDVVLVELPTYIGGTSSFLRTQRELAGVEQDDDGIVPESLAEVAARTKPKLLYTIPNFQNPSGRLMTQQRRAEVLRDRGGARLPGHRRRSVRRAGVRRREPTRWR